jgi:hypothetical protein
MFCLYSLFSRISCVPEPVPGKHIPPPFKWRHFGPTLILLCVRWYCRYQLSYTGLEEIMRERGLSIDHTSECRPAPAFFDGHKCAAWGGQKSRGEAPPIWAHKPTQNGRNLRCAYWERNVFLRSTVCESGRALPADLKRRACPRVLLTVFKRLDPRPPSAPTISP